VQNSSRYWFPAKRYGWGWGLPCAWQGWLIFIGWLIAVCSGIILLQASSAYRHLMPLFVTIMAALLIGACYLTGEPPRWRWGDRE
jgi:hypothetical protein